MSSISSDDRWPEALALLLEEKCNHFEAAWRNAGKAGRPPELETYLAEARPEVAADLFGELLPLDLHYRRQRGESTSRGDYLSRFPEHAPLIEQCFPQGLTVSIGAGSPVVEALAACLPASLLEAPPWHPTSDSPRPTGPSLPGYEILEELGRGGMGVVYKARQTDLNRVVALKMVLAGTHAGSGAVLRFQAEAKAAARLQHPGIVQIYETGTWDDSGQALPYLAMELCTAGSLAAKLKGDPQPPAQAADIVEQLARAIHAAHAAGVVHRDLKPANVLLDSEGRLKIADFGLAKVLDAENNQTRTGAVMGTPAYMAPEQARDSKTAGPSADVYALGAILYECLTGRPPFNAPTVLEILSLLRDTDPVPVRQLQPGVPRDLETICAKCLHKEPARRYGSARDLGDDLRRFAAGEPIRGRPVGPAERAWRWVCRHRALAALYAVSAVVVVLALVLGFFFSIQQQRLDVEKAKAEAADAREQAALVQGQAQRFLGLAGSARSRIARQQPGWTWLALEEIGQAAALPAAAESLAALRSDAAECITSLDVRQVGEVGEGQVYSLAWSADGKTLAIGQRAVNPLLSPSCLLSLIRLDNSATRVLSAPQKAVAGKAGSQDSLRLLSYSRDGRWIAAGARSGWVHCWDLTRPASAPVWSRQAHEGEVTGLAFSGDGRSLYSCGGKTVRHYEPERGKDVALFDAARDTNGLAVHPSEGWVAVGGISTLRLDATDLRRLGPQSEFYAWPIEFSADGHCLLGARGHWVHVWNLSDQAMYRRLTPAKGFLKGETLSSLDCSPDGSLVLTSSALAQHRRVRLWDAVANRVAAEVPFDGGVGKVAFAPDGLRFAVSDEKRVKVYEVNRGGSEQTYAAIELNHPVRSFCLSPDGRTLATEARFESNVPDAELRQWSLTPGAMGTWLGRNTIVPGPGERQWLSLSNSGKLAFARHSGEMYPDCPGLTLPSTPLEKLAGLNDLGRDGIGRLWAATGDAIVLWDEGGRRLGSHKHRRGWGQALTGKPGVLSLGIGRAYTVAGCRDGSLAALQATATGPTQSGVRELSRGELTAAAVSADDKFAVAGSATGELIVATLPEVRKSSTIAAHGDTVIAVRSGGNGLIASGDRHGQVKLWRLEDGELRELLTLRHPHPVVDMRFHADGGRLYVLLEDEYGVRVHHLEKLRDRLDGLGVGQGLEAIRKLPLPETSVSPQAAATEKPTGPAGLKAEWFATGFLTAPRLIRYERHIGDSAAPRDCRSVRWSGWLRPPEAGAYSIALAPGGRGRLWLDGVLVIDVLGGAFRTDVLLEDRPHEIRLEIEEYRSDSPPSLRWSSAEGIESVVGAANLFHDRATALATRPDRLSMPRVVRNFTEPVGADIVAFSADGRQIAAGSPKNGVVVWERNGGKKVLSARVRLEESLGVFAFSADLRRCVAVGEERSSLWDLATDKEIAGWDHPRKQPPYGATFSPDGKRLVLAGDRKSGLIRVAEADAGGKVVWSDQSGQLLDKAIWTRDGKGLLSADWGKRNVQWWSWDGAKASVTRTFAVAPHPPNNLALSADGRTLAILGFQENQSTVQIVHDGKVIRSWQGPKCNRDHSSLTFSADGRIVALAGVGGVWLWEVESGRELAWIAEQESFGVCFSRDGVSMLTCGSDKDKPVRLWRIDAVTQALAAKGAQR